MTVELVVVPVDGPVHDATRRLAPHPDQRRFSGTAAEALDRAATDPCRTPVVALEAGRPVAFLVLDTGPEIAGQTGLPAAVGMRAFLVDAAQQGRGVAGATLRALPALVRRAFPDADGVALTVNVANPAAIAAYRRAGFADTGRRYLGGAHGPQLVLHHDGRTLTGPVPRTAGAPMTRIKIGFQCQPQHSDFDQMRRAWREAEELGVDAIFNWDHFYPLYGDPDGKHFEAIATLGAMAQVTERAQIGSLVICNSYRNPELLVDAHRTLDHISGGRAILGIGAGWFQKDYDEYGYEFGEAKDRVADLRRALPRIEARRAKLNPQPIGDLPILIGGAGPKVTLKLVARHGNMWHSFGDADTFREKDAILRDHCKDAGRDPDEIERTWGTPDRFDGAWADEVVDAGVQHLIVGAGGSDSGYDLGKLREAVQWRDARGD